MVTNCVFHGETPLDKLKYSNPHFRPLEEKLIERFGHNWNSDTPPSAEQIVESLQEAIRKQGIDLEVSNYRMYGEGRSDGFELTDRDTGEVLFSMDIDVNRPIPPTKMYVVEGLHFRGVAPAQMIADKISAVSSDKAFRRINDVVDLFYLTKVFDFDKGDVLQRPKDGGRELGDFHGFLHRCGELEHSYEKFRLSGDVDKPPFEDVYRAVKMYIKGPCPRKETWNANDKLEVYGEEI